MIWTFLTFISWVFNHIHKSLRGVLRTNISSCHDVSVFFDWTKKHPKLTMNEKRATCNMQLDLYFLHTYSLMMLVELVASSKWKSDLLDPCVDWCAERNLSNTMSSHNSTDFTTPDYTCFYLCIPSSYLSSQKGTTIKCHHKTGKTKRLGHFL